MVTEKAPVWIGITYLVYSAILLTLCLGGTGYAVFALDRSGWWLLAGFFIAGCGYSPAKWHALWSGVDPTANEAD